MLQYGRVHVGFMFETLNVFVADADELRIILSSEFEAIDRAEVEQQAFDELLGDGLILMSNGPRWKQVRLSIRLQSRTVRVPAADHGLAIRRPVS